MTKSIIFVLGMHRSGTSLVTKALEAVGANLGDTLIPAAADNPKGFFEDEDCVKLNETILTQLDMRWDIPSLMLEQDLSDQILVPYVKEAAHLLKTKLVNTNTFAVKDPRICLLAPIWIAAAKMANVTPSFVVTVRNPLDVAHSLWKRNQFEYQKGLDLWLSHNYKLTDFLLQDASKRIVVSYENMLTQPEKELGRLVRFVDSKATIETHQQAIDDFTANFVDASLAHSQSDLAELDQQSSFTCLTELYQALDGFANGRWSKEKALKSIQTINPLAIESGFYRNQLKYFNKDIHQALGKQYHQLEDRFKEEYADLRAQVAEFKSTAEQKQQYIELLQAQADQVIREFEQKQQQNAQLEESVQQLSGTIEQKEQYIQELREQSSLLLRDRDTNIRRKQRELFNTERQVAQIAVEKAIIAQQHDETDQHLQAALQQVENFEELKHVQQETDQHLQAALERVEKHEELQHVQQETDKHLQGSLVRINDIHRSLSYKAGRLVTWPIRKPYDVLLEPLVKHPDNLQLLGQLASQVVRHPVQSAQMMRWEVIRNAYITFFKDPDVAGNVVDHYVRLFEGENYQPAPIEDSIENPIDQAADHTVASSKNTKPERVSVFVINYNGRHHLDDLLTSLQAQSYEDFEVIVVDNASTDGSVEYIQQHFPTMRIISLQENTGFAEANNIAAEVASGCYYCLLNNDAEVDADWLSSLVACITQSDKIGAVGSKILFWKKFINIELSIQPASLKRRVLLDQEMLESSAPIYKKLFFGSGWKDEQLFDNRKTQMFDKHATLWFPICEGQTTIKFTLYSRSTKSVKVSLNTSVDTQTDVVLQPNAWTEVSLDLSNQLDHPGLGYLINNAGSQVDDRGQAQDRGFAVPDQGQYNSVETVTALCGGAMLIRPEALVDKPIFGKEFFAYFEDTDLSLRIREQGFDLRYCPDSIVYHKHASTSQENSPFFRFYVNRNRILFLALHYPEDLWKKAKETAQAELNHLQHYIQQHSDDPEQRQFAQQIPEIFDDWERLLPKIENNSFFERQNRFPKLAVYNNFWHTLGGGEHHACVIAQALENLGPVDLISENDFSIEKLEQQFNIQLKQCRKRLVSSQQMHHDPATTSQYDVFVNSTYSSNLISHAKHSYYVVSFPYKIPSYPVEGKEFLKSYALFLANSRYTAGWVKQWWNVDNCEVVYPSIAIPDIAFDQIKKTTNILHVGRFFRSGHNKKQLELVRVFKHLIDSGKVDSGWTLTLVGQVDPAQQAYLDEVLEEAQGYPIEILNNVALESLTKLYEESAIYWHATGLGESNERSPERNEHFGISTVEAMSYGCVPIVINAGGQPESVVHEKNGFLFDNEKQLQAYTMQCIQLFSQAPEQYRELSKQAIITASNFSRSHTKQSFLCHLSDVVFQWYSEYKLL